MYDDNNSFEKAPGSTPEAKPERSVPLEQDFSKSFKQGVPPFAGEQFGMAHQGNEFYGEANDDEAETDEGNYNEGLSNAASLINYGLDAVAREKGVEAVVQGIKSFDASRSDNPLRDLYTYLGVNTVEELDDARDESAATKAARERFRNEYNMPKTQHKSREGAIRAIQDMKELIAEVEGADPRYQELRSSARSYGKGYFEYAVKDYGLRGLTDLFGVLAEQKEKKDKIAKQPEEQQSQQPESESEPKPNKSELELELESELGPESELESKQEPEPASENPNNLNDEEDEKEKDKEKDPRIVSSQ